MEELIIIRAVDHDGTLFQILMDALQDKSIHVIESTSSVLSLGDIEIHPSFHRVLRDGKEVYLNHGEYSILYCLAKTPGRVFTKEQLYSAAWGNDGCFGLNTVESTIHRLRKKLEPNPKHPKYIITIIGTGYKLVIPDE